jgi:hypothetical protein
MRTYTLVLAALLSVGCNSGGVAANKYHPEKICPESITPAECDLLVEKVVSADIPGVVQRSGSILRIQARNGKRVERKTADPAVWACDYLPEHGYLRLCYRLWEESQTEFVSLKSGESLIVSGWPIYSPSRRKVLMVNGYGGEIYSLEIWRFGEKALVREFRRESPPGEGWEIPTWKGENEILPKPKSTSSGQRLRLVRDGNSWVIRD